MKAECENSLSDCSQSSWLHCFSYSPPSPSRSLITTWLPQAYPDSCPTSLGKPVSWSSPLTFFLNTYRVISQDLWKAVSCLPLGFLQVLGRGIPFLTLFYRVPFLKPALSLLTLNADTFPVRRHVPRRGPMRDLPRHS